MFQNAPWSGPPLLKRSSLPPSAFQTFKISFLKFPASAKTSYKALANSVHNSTASSLFPNIVSAVSIHFDETASLTEFKTSAKVLASCTALNAFKPKTSKVSPYFSITSDAVIPSLLASS